MDLCVAAQRNDVRMFHQKQLIGDLSALSPCDEISCISQARAETYPAEIFVSAGLAGLWEAGSTRAEKSASAVLAVDPAVKPSVETVALIPLKR